MTNVFYEVVESRRTIRDFLADPVPTEVLERCIEAACKAPSSSNLQPWEFVLIENPQKRIEANHICLNQGPVKTAPVLLAIVTHWAHWRRNRDEILRVFEARGPIRPSTRRYYSQIIPLVYTNGPFNLIGFWKPFVGRLLSIFRPTPSLQTKNDIRVMAHKSTALAAATLMLALRAEGFDSCPMEGFDPWRAKNLLNLGSQSEVCMFLAVGKRSEKGVWWQRILIPRVWTFRKI
ncbi:MAG: nitroreductase family protein [Holophagaceae bacterium]|jgi:nitroreductase